LHASSFANESMLMASINEKRLNLTILMIFLGFEHTASILQKAVKAKSAVFNL